MKNYIIFLALALFNVNQKYYCQNNLSGKITSQETKQPLHKAAIHVTDLKTTCLTDTNGFFTVKDLKPGSYLLEISFENHQSVLQKVTLPQDTLLYIILQESVKELHEVVITGMSRSTEIKMSPVIVKSISLGELNENSATNLIDGLRTIPGINQVSTGSSISKPVIRGLGYNRVITLYNGMRQEGQQWGDEHGIEIDEYAVDKIELIKGPGSLMYGSDGIAGVLNFITPKALPVGTTKTQLISNYQSNANLIGNSISTSGNTKGLQWSGRFSSKYAGNYQNKYDGKVYNSGFNETNGSLFLGINKKWGYTQLNASTFNTVLNLIEGERDSLGNFIFTREDGARASADKNDLKGYSVGFPHQQINHLRLSFNNYFILKKGTLHVDLGIQNNKRKEFGDATQPKTIALFFDLTTVNYDLRYNFKETKGWETATGISGMQQSNTNKGLEYLIPNYQSFDIGAFIHTQKKFKNKLTLAGGLRFDNRKMNAKELLLDSLGIPVNQLDSGSELKFSSFIQNYNGISGSIGIAYQANKHATLKANISRGFRAPNIAEIASNGRHEGSFRYEYGTVKLNSEISHQFDLAYFYNSDHLTLEVTPFANLISNYVYAKKLTTTLGLDSIPDPTDPAPAYQFAQSNATLMGGEFYFDLHPHPFDWLHLENSFSYVQGVLKNQSDSTNYLPFIPAPKYRAAIKAEFKKIGTHLNNFYFKIAIDHYFTQDKCYAAYGTETVTPAYTLWSAGCGGTIATTKKKELLAIYVSAENLSNVAYQSHLSRLKYGPTNPLTGRTGVFNMGRNISLKLIFTL
jgi:iron complex outermembrane receptor protein